jgi:pimeloyl-ACP methyl ester carboxylesterase
MSGRHTGEQHHHTVEGTDPQLYVEVHEPAADAGLRPVLLLHGFSSSTRLNWQDTGWLTALLEAGRRVITVDLPGHGRSGAPEDMDSYSPSRIRADLLQVAFDAGVRPLRDGDPVSGLDVIGYSLGSRLAWEFGATQPELVHRLVLGGPNIADPLAAFDLVAAQRYLADGTPIADESTAGLLKMAQGLPSNNVFALLSLVEAIKGEPFDPAEAIPHMPMLLVAGEKDDRAATMPELAELGAKSGALVEQLLIPGRNHSNVITSRAFKQGAIDFLSV